MGLYGSSHVASSSTAFFHLLKNENISWPDLLRTSERKSYPCCEVHNQKEKKQGSIKDGNNAIESPLGQKF